MPAMENYKSLLVRQIMKDARQKVAKLSKEFARAKSEDKEAVLAEMEFEKELAEMCDVALG
jgi:hypothetical protein